LRPPAVFDRNTGFAQLFPLDHPQTLALQRHIITDNIEKQQADKYRQPLVQILILAKGARS
jgi:hypothetical protein